MEIVFAIIAICVTLLFWYAVGRLVFNHKDLLRNVIEDENLLAFNLVLILLNSITLWITLCATNNTFWHLPYFFRS